MSNPVSDYMARHDVGTVAMARLLGVSKGYASLLKDGEKPITPRIARKLGELNKKPWWKYMPGEAAA